MPQEDQLLGALLSGGRRLREGRKWWLELEYRPLSSGVWGPSGSGRCQSWSIIQARVWELGVPGLPAWVLWMPGAGPSSSSQGLVKAEELPFTFCSGFLATAGAALHKGSGFSSWGSWSGLGRWSRPFGDSSPLLLLASSPLILHVCPSAPPDSSNG